MDDQSFKHLCRSFADHYKCTVVERDPDLWVVELSPRLARTLGQKRWVLCFHRALLDADPDAQLVTAGAQIIQTIKETLEREGLVAECGFKPRFALPQDVPAGVTPLAGTLTFIGSSVQYRTLARVNFRLSIVGVERHEEYFPVVLDANKLTAGPDRLSRLLEGYELVAGLPLEGKVVPIRESEFLEAAYQMAEARALEIVADFQEQAVRETDEERKQAIEYFSRMEQQESDSELKASFPEIRRRRLAELDERARLEVELEPHGIQFYRLPVARTEVRFANGQNSKKVAIDTDLLSGNLLIGKCSRHPNVRLDHLTLCEAHGLGCKQCHWACATCGKTGCPECPCYSCSECNGVHCASCRKPCASCGSRHARNHLTKCSSGCGEVCSLCRRIVENTLHCAKCTVVADCRHEALKEGLARCSVDGHTLCLACARQRTTCQVCNSLCCSRHLHVCAGGGESVCEKCAARMEDGRYACAAHGMVCSCNRWLLKPQVEICATHRKKRCAHCQWTCVSCKKTQCADCPSLNCKICSGKHCVDCVVTCSVCKSKTGKNHATLCTSGCGAMCPKCVVLVESEAHCKRCTKAASCGHVEIKSRLTKCEIWGESSCRKCAVYYKSCTICGKTSCPTHFNICAGGGEVVCVDCAPARLPSGVPVCSNHAAKCKCGVLSLRAELQVCSTGQHGTSCSYCRWRCSSCQKVGCGQCEGIICEHCNKNHCADCLGVCAGCGERTGRTHLKQCLSVFPQTQLGADVACLVDAGWRLSLEDVKDLV